MKITWHGHSFYEVETATGMKLLLDPFVENGVTGVRVEDLQPDLTLVTHAHSDHVGQAVEIGAPVVTNYEIATALERRGAQIAADLNVGGTYRNGGLKIWMGPAAHSSGFHTDEGFLGYGGNPCGFLIDDGETRFYHAGDTGLFGDMKDVIRDVLRPDVVAVPIGDHYTMGPEHAAIAVDWMGAKVATPMHYNTFEPIRQDPQVFADALEGKARVVVLDVDAAFEVKGGKVTTAAQAQA